MGSNEGLKCVLYLGAFVGGLFGLATANNSRVHKIYKGTLVKEIDEQNTATVQVIPYKPKNFKMMNTVRAVPVMKSVCENDNNQLW